MRGSTVGEAAAWWLGSRVGRVQASTLERDGQVMRCLPAWFLGMDVAGVTGEDVFAVALGWPGASNTKNRALVSVKALFRDLAGAGWVESNPAAGVPRPKAGAPPRAGCAVEWEAVPAVAAAVGARHPAYGDLVMFAAHTGLRWGELAELRFSDLRAGGAQVAVSRAVTVGGLVKEPKSGRARVVPLDGAARAAVAYRAAGRGPGDLVFTSPMGERVARRNFTARSGWLEAAPGHHPHCLRHCYAVHLLDVPGVATSDIQRWLGHGSLATTERYLGS
ncbi:MAG: site-specific integrase, partial [Bifidobacteriaceae bacterium]|nr:site-specific integrase [Bifidobacteriaceae bacterium]